MSRYTLSSDARAALREIRAYHLDREGKRVARETEIEFVNAFRLLAGNPSLGLDQPPFTPVLAGALISDRLPTTANWH